MNEPESNISGLRKRAIRGGWAMVVSKIVNQGISFGVVWIQAHYLPVDQYGIFGMLLGTVMYISTLGSGGSSDIVRRFLPEFAEEGEKWKIAATVRGVVLVRFVLSALFLGLTLVFFRYFAGFLDITDYRFAYSFFTLGILFTVEARLMWVIYWALLKQVKYSVIFTIYNLLRLVTFYLVLKSGGGLIEALAVDAGSQIFLFLALYIPFVAEYPLKKEPHEQDVPVRRLSRFGAFMYFGNFGHILFNTTTDMYVISAFMDKVSLGYYSFAVNLGRAVMKWMPTKLVGSVIESVVMRDYTRRDSADALPMQFSKIVTAEAFFVIPSTVFMLTYASPLIREVFGTKFLPAENILRGLAVVFAVSSLKFPLEIVARALEKAKLLFYTQVFFAVYNLVGDLILIPRIGLWGAVLATGSSHLLVVVTIWIILGGEVSLPLEKIPLLKIAATAFLMGIFFHFPAKEVASVWSFIGCFLAGGLLYLILTAVNPPYPGDVLKRYFRGIMGR